jgi:hypothetical protein
MTLMTRMTFLLAARVPVNPTTDVVVAVSAKIFVAIMDIISAGYGTMKRRIPVAQRRLLMQG